MFLKLLSPNWHSLRAWPPDIPTWDTVTCGRQELFFPPPPASADWLVGLGCTKAAFIMYFLGIFGVWKGPPFLSQLISSIRAFPFPQQKVCSHPWGQAEVAGVATCSRRLTSNSNLEPYMVRSNLKCSVSFHLGRARKQTQVPSKPGGCFLASGSGEGAREGGEEPMCVWHVCELFLQQRLFWKQQSGALYVWVRSTQKNLLSGGKIAWVIVHELSLPSWNVWRIKDNCGHSNVFIWEVREGTPGKWGGKLSSKTKKAGIWKALPPLFLLVSILPAGGGTWIEIPPPTRSPPSPCSFPHLPL